MKIKQVIFQVFVFLQGGTEEPAAYGELVSIGGLSPDVNNSLSSVVASTLEKKLSVPKSRLFLKSYDSQASHLNS
uniref:Macrophage migration inhibitory factor family protein n=1 Tax=Salix viminalis TaxID=40686 RepID=A0A6N2K7X8_SALVM